MNSKRFKKIEGTLEDFDDSWEEEIERLKHEIKRAEKRLFKSEQNRLADNAKLLKGFNTQDNESVRSTPVDVSTPPLVEGLIRARKYKKIGDVPVDKISKESVAEIWTSPAVAKPRQTKRDMLSEQFGNCLESSFDCGSSIISLDFGLVSPNKTWCSPPQRIERAQNREWSSPHRVIDRPNPENSPGNWISMKESCAAPRHSPALGVKNKTVKESSFGHPEPESRPASQSTYVVHGAVPPPELNAKDNQPTRKISVLENYEPERVISTNKRPGDSSEPVERNLLPSNEKMRKVVVPIGHVVKVSLLGDFEAPVFGRTHEKPSETAAVEAKEPLDKTAKGTTKTAASSAKSSPSLRLQAKKKEKEPKEGGINTGKSGDDAGVSEDDEENKNVDLGKSVHKMIENFENIFTPTKEDADKMTPLSVKIKLKPGKLKPKKTKSETDRVEEKPLEPPEKRKRNVDTKVVREYIKSQKQKRIEQVKMEKKTKDAEKETRKKNLEELRIKTLKIATQSKKKKSPRRTFKEVKPVTEDDVTMSLGLKQETPRVSYNESISKLKKKTVHQKPQPAPAEPQPSEEIPEVSGGEEDGGDKTQDIIAPEVTEEVDLKKPEESADQKDSSDLNTTLKKLAESLHLKIDQKAKEIRSKPSPPALKSAKDPPPQIPSQDTPQAVKSTPEENRQVVAVDMETIRTLKSDIKQISENFKVLHEIIAEKGEPSGRESVKQLPPPPKPKLDDIPQEFPVWLKSFAPKPYPFNVFSAFQKKMNLKTKKALSSVSQGSCTFAEHSSNKYDSEFEHLSVPSDRLRTVKEIAGSFRSTSCGTYEENYFSMKDDSGSELSSSILDSDKQSAPASKRDFSEYSSKAGSDSVSSSIITEITSRSIQKSKVFSLTYAKSSCSGVHSRSSCTRVDSKGSFSKGDSGRENLILITPDIKLISNDLHQEKLNNCTKNLNLYQNPCEHIPEELNNSEKSCKAKTDSTVAEVIDNLSMSTNAETRRSLTHGEEKGQVRRSFFQPEILHLQFQAELNLIEKFQQSLTHFLEAERAKSLAEVNKIVYEKAMNTEKHVDKEDRSIQAAYLELSEKTTFEGSDSVETEINAVDSIKTDQPDSPKKEDLVSELVEKLSSSSKETLKEELKDLDNSELSSEHLSLQTLNNTMKDEELRSEHLLALIRLREKTLTEKVKAELTFLEMKKRALKERGGDEEQNISAIKKKQRGILLKYQSEKEDIERLKRMHKVTSEERKTVMKRQKQIQQMQISDSGTIRLKKREKSPLKKAPLKPKALNFDSQSEIPESIPIVSDSLLSECSPDDSKHSSRSEPDLSLRSNVQDVEIQKPCKSKTCLDLENFKSRKSQLEVERYPWKQRSVEDLMKWSKRLEEKENHLKELEKQTVSTAVKAKSRLMKSLKNSKTSMKDRSTSPFQFQDSGKTPSEVSIPEALEAKKSTTISEEIETNPKTVATDRTESVVEKLQSSASEDIPEDFSKKIATSRTSEYQSESFESPSSSETPKIKPEVMTPRSEWGHKSIAIKLSLSPRMRSPGRRCSSGSDDSVNLSHTETASEQSDLESRIAALHEQLRMRKLEAERLRREQKKAQRERLKVKEQCLLNQIQAYDAYIQKKKQELEREYEHSNQTVMKPLIRQPGVAEKRRGDLTIMKRSDREKPEAKTTDKESSYMEKTPGKESESEVAEQIKASSESIGEVLDESDSTREQIESKLEEEEKSKMTESLAAEQSLKESFDEGKSTSLSESLPEHEGSQSESEDQSISVKTTLQSPEKQDTDFVEVLTVAEEGSQEKQTTEDYHFDSFESDPDERVSDAVQKMSEAIKETDSDSTAVNEYSESASLMPREGEEDEEKKGKTEKVEKITDSIIMGLILESVNAFCNKKAEAEKKLAEESRLSLEILSGFLAKEIISEAVEDTIRIYNRKTGPEGERIPEQVTSEVRRRISEIMSQTGPARDQKRPQDVQEVMTTAYDISLPDEPGSDDPERERFLQSLSLLKNEKPEKQAVTKDECNSHESKTGTSGQEWVDDDFELSQTRREAEELRLQQLQIEQEIQQLQAQQKQVPYFYLREIPNKPPPPYTPPTKPITEIPATESEIMRITFNAVRILTDEMSKGKPIADIAPDWDYYGEAVSENYKCYKFFLFDLAKHIISDLMAQQEKKVEVLPWMRTRKRLSKYKYQKIERTFGCLNDFVQRQIVFLFGFGRKVSKESLIVRWIKKKRDHVDEILVGESQEEEAQWTQYDEDQVTVKNEITLSILDGLLEDTAQLVNAIFNNKMEKGKKNFASLQSEECFK